MTLASEVKRMVQQSEPQDRLQGLTKEGFLDVDNHYRCPHCAHKTQIPLYVLGERAARWARGGPEELELDDDDIPFFTPFLEQALAGGPSRLRLEFDCRCGRPVAMVVAVVPGQHVERFSPVIVVDRIA